MPKQYICRPPMIIIGPSIAYVPLTQDQWALIDSDDATNVAVFSWYALWSKCTESFYAIGWDGTRKVKLHRFIMGFGYGDKRHVDHRNGRTLDFGNHILDSLRSKGE